MKILLLTQKIKFHLLIVLLLASLKLNGQQANVNALANSGNDTRGVYNSQLKYIRDQYSQKLINPNEIIYGKEYVSYYVRSAQKPLLMNKVKRRATLFTSIRKYTNVDLQYDTFLDEVILTDTSRIVNFSYPMIALNKDIIYGFNLYFENDSMNFKYLRTPWCSENNLKEGFYEIAYQGKSQYFIKHLSTYFTREGLNEYNYSPENYISTGGKFFKISGKESLLKLFGDKSGEIKKFMHSSGIRIRQADKGQYISILKYYDSLNKAN